jgi:hypothetical protein
MIINEKVMKGNKGQNREIGISTPAMPGFRRKLSLRKLKHPVNKVLSLRGLVPLAFRHLLAWIASGYRLRNDDALYTSLRAACGEAIQVDRPQSRRDGTLLTGCFSFRTGCSPHSPQSRRDGTLFGVDPIGRRLPFVMAAGCHSNTLLIINYKLLIVN